MIRWFLFLCGASLIACYQIKFSPTHKPILNIPQIAVASLVPFFIIDMTFSSSIKLLPTIVHADSTGKFSTKLTARKRYLPRIISGVSDLRKALKSPVSSIASFNTDSLPSLLRAMNLYGASLRKGEAPDEIRFVCLEFPSFLLSTIFYFQSNCRTSDWKIRYSDVIFRKKSKFFLGHR